MGVVVVVADAMRALFTPRLASLAPSDPTSPRIISRTLQAVIGEVVLAKAETLPPNGTAVAAAPAAAPAGKKGKGNAPTKGGGKGKVWHVWVWVYVGCVFGGSSPLSPSTRTLFPLILSKSNFQVWREGGKFLSVPFS